MNSDFENIPGYIKYSILLVGICALGFLLFIGQDIIIPLCFALLFAILLDPLVTFFEKIKIPRILAIILAIIVGFLLITALIYFVSVQLSSFDDTLPNFKERFGIVIEKIKTWLSTELNISRKAINTQFDKWSKSALEESGTVIGYSVTKLTELIVIWLLIPVYVYLFLYYEKLLLLFIEKISEKENQKAIAEVMMEGKKMIQSYLAGLLLEIIIMAVLNIAGLMILGIDYAVLLGIIGALLNVVPYIGGIISTALPMMIAIVTKDSLISPLLVLGVYLLIQFIDNNFIVPFVVASRVKINALVSIIVVLIFGSLFGIAGMFLAIPMTAIFKIIFDRVESLKPYSLLLGTETPGNTVFHKIFKKFDKSKPDNTKDKD